MKEKDISKNNKEGNAKNINEMRTNQEKNQDEKLIIEHNDVDFENKISDESIDNNSPIEHNEALNKEIMDNELIKNTEELFKEDPTINTDEIITEEDLKDEQFDSESEIDLLYNEDLEQEEEEEEEEIIDEEEQKRRKEEQEKHERNFAELSKEELIQKLKELINDPNFIRNKEAIEAIKVNFYKKHRIEQEKNRKKHLEEGGTLETFKIIEDPLEKELKNLLALYKEKKSEYNKKLEEEKLKNLQEKYKIIEELKELVNKQESINKTFQEFRELQQRWREIGPVPQQYVSDLWKTYHYHVEAFYDYIKLNKELRDLDFKKNLEAKIELCEKAESLLLDPSPVKAFKELQYLHEQWREIGPVPPEMRSEIWKRFKEASSKINKRYQEHFIKIKEEQRKNLQAKIALCEKVEDILKQEIKSVREWKKYSQEIIEIQKIWKTIGFAPRRDNNRIYRRFRKACDSFFNRKREYFKEILQRQYDNLQMKLDLCVQAEALAESTDWKNTTEELIALQKKWKEIGPVPPQESENVWRRFRAACDKFFERKAQYFASIDSSYENNLKRKEEIIKKIEELQLTGDIEKDLEEIRKLQREWANIGFVPFKYKDQIQERYRQALNKKLESLEVDEDQKTILKYKTKLENIKAKPNAEIRFQQEKDKITTKLKQLESDILIWENNIGFFSKSKNAESMINEIQRRIDNTKHRIALLKEKLRLLEKAEEEYESNQ